MQFKSTLVLAAICAISACVGNGAVAPEPTSNLPDFSKLGDRFEDIKSQAEAPGASVAVSVDGNMVWSTAFGAADLEQGVDASEETKFRVGSTSKPMTATVLARLVERGVVKLDDEVHDYLDDYPETGRGITLAMLASNQSGVRHYRDNEFMIGEKIWWQHYPTTASALPIFSEDDLVQPPGQDFFYSSYGWTLLAAALEAATGETFPTLLQREVFDPIGMQDTHIDHHFMIVPNRTRFYWRAPTGDITNAPFTENSYKYAGGGILSTSEDLIRFGNAWIDGAVVSPDLRDEMWKRQKNAAGEETVYGLGWFVGLEAVALRFAGENGPVPSALMAIQAAGIKSIEHRGGQMGASTVLWLFPDHDVVVAANWNMTGEGRRLYEASLLVACETLAKRPGVGPLDCDGSPES